MIYLIFCPFSIPTPYLCTPLTKRPTYQNGLIAAKIVSFPYPLIQVYPDISTPEVEVIFVDTYFNCYFDTKQDVRAVQAVSL